MTFTIENCSVIASTEKAILVESDNLDEETWIPRSEKVISDDSEVYKDNTTGDLIVSDWFAKKKGWI